MRELVYELQAELAGSGDYDGRPRHFRDAYNDSEGVKKLVSGHWLDGIGQVVQQVFRRTE